MVLRRLRDPSGAGDTALPPEKPLEKSEYTIRPLPAVAFINAHIRIYTDAAKSSMAGEVEETALKLIAEMIRSYSQILKAVAEIEEAGG
jgi:hypothetical protein